VRDDLSLSLPKCSRMYRVVSKVRMLFLIAYIFNSLEFRGNYSATSNNMKLVHWPLMSGLLHLVQRGGDWAGPQSAQAPPRCTKRNSPPIDGHCIPIIIVLTTDPLLSGFSVAIKGLKSHGYTVFGNYGN